MYAKWLRNLLLKQRSRCIIPTLHTHPTNMPFQNHNCIKRCPISIQFFGFCRFSIAYLQMQHESGCVDVMSRDWRTWRMNQITPTYTYIPQVKVKYLHDYVPSSNPLRIWLWGSRSLYSLHVSRSPVEGAAKLKLIGEAKSATLPL